MMKNSLLCILGAFVILTSCGCTNKAEKEVPPSDNFVRMTDGVLLPGEQLLGYPVTFSILLPKNYTKDKDKRYPVVYMLHGLGDKPESWNDSWLRVQPTIEGLEDEGLGDMIYVFPSGFRTYYCNRYNGKYPYMDMFVTELIPYIDATYRTIADKDHRAVTGYSMGGFGACALALKHPELFCASAPLSMSFRTDEQYMTESQDGWDSQWGSIFGGAGTTGADRLTDYYKAHCPFYQFTAANKSNVSGVHWFFTCGDNEEQLLIAGDDLHVQMRDAGIDHEYRVGDGGHEGSYWRAALKEVLPMFDYYMNGGTLWKPLADREEVQPLSYDDVFISPAYASGSGTQAFLVHSGLGKAELGKLMAAMDKSNLDKAFVIVPCDLTKETLAACMARADVSWPAAKRICVTVGTDGSQALASADRFERTIFIDSSFSTAPTVKEGQKAYFSCADDAPNYAGMGALYKACKKAGATFEYRVLNSTSDRNSDWILSIKSLISTIIY